MRGRLARGFFFFFVYQRAGDGRDRRNSFSNRCRPVGDSARVRPEDAPRRVYIITYTFHVRLFGVTRVTPGREGGRDDRKCSHGVCARR